MNHRVLLGALVCIVIGAHAFVAVGALYHLIPEAEADVQPAPSGVNMNRSGHIARNIIEGNAIHVCTDDYPNAVRDAVNALNDGMHNHTPAFLAANKHLFVRTASCGTTADDEDIDHVRIESRSPSDDDYFCGEANGCFLWPVRSGPPHYTYTGPVLVLMNEQARPRAYDALNNINNARYKRVVRTVAHELGHVLGLGDHQCDDMVLPGTAVRSLMQCSWLAIRDFDVDLDWAYPLQDRDFDDYAAIYTPRTVQRRVVSDGTGSSTTLAFAANVTNTSGASTGDVVFNFDASAVVTEDQIEIRRWNGTAWVSLQTFGPKTGATAWTATGEPSGPQTYRIFSTTHAYVNPEAQCRERDSDCNPTNDPDPSALGAVIGFPTDAITLNVASGTTDRQLIIRIPGGGGTVRASPAPPYTADTDVTLTAVPDTGTYAGRTATLTRLGSWSGDDASGCTAPNPCTVSVTGVTVVEAGFVPIEYDLTIARPIGVGSTQPPHGTATYRAGEVVPVRAVWNDRTHRLRWSGCTGTPTTNGTCTAYMNRAMTVTPTFVERPRLTHLSLSGQAVTLHAGTSDYEEVLSGTSPVTVDYTATRGIVTVSPGDDDASALGWQVKRAMGTDHRDHVDRQ